jgi:hypothetical protein
VGLGRLMHLTFEVMEGEHVAGVILYHTQILAM